MLEYIVFEQEIGASLFREGVNTLGVGFVERVRLDVEVYSGLSVI